MNEKEKADFFAFNSYLFRSLIHNNFFGEILYY